LVNRVLFPADVASCRRCRRTRQWQLSTLAGLRRGGDSAEIYLLKNFAAEIAGKRGLRSLTAQLWQPV
jgi:hypothetical protein